MSIVIYTDGSEVRTDVGAGRQYMSGYGVVAHYQNTTIELHGAVLLPSKVSGVHEIQAFLEGMLFALSHGFEYEDMVFYTDCRGVAYCGFYLFPENYVSKVTVERHLEKMQQVCELYYPAGTYEKALECSVKARFVKVKSHSNCVYNQRVDYLAKHGVRSRLGIPSKLFDFETWIDEGLCMHGQDGLAYHWRVPFSSHTQ